jgi:hypothetical protein
MNRKYLLINSEKLNIPNWAKWVVLILTYFLSMVVISQLESITAKAINVPLNNIYIITFYVRGFIALSLIHDLAPKLKKSISIIYSIYLPFIYLYIDAHIGDKSYLGTFLFIIIIIIFNIFIYRKDRKI